MKLELNELQIRTLLRLINEAITEEDDRAYDAQRLASERQVQQHEAITETAARVTALRDGTTTISLNRQAEAAWEDFVDGAGYVNLLTPHDTGMSASYVGIVCDRFSTEYAVHEGVWVRAYTKALIELHHGRIPAIS
jgi:hypothetical protein